METRLSLAPQWGQAAGLGHLVGDAADHVAKGVLDDLVVRNQGLGGILGHRLSW